MEQTCSIPNQHTLRTEYNRLLPIRTAIIKDIEARIEDIIKKFHSGPTVKGRVKSFMSFYKKYIGLLKKQADTASPAPPLITDLIGVRIVCPFLEDLAAVETIMKETFTVTEVEYKGSNYSFKEFGYESIHLLIGVPPELCARHGDPQVPAAEVQIRTILQDAWAEVEHELFYKAEFSPYDKPLKRKLAAVNASLSLADTIFQDIRTYQRQLNGQLGMRRESFFKKIEDSTDVLVFEDESLLDADTVPAVPAVPPLGNSDTIDDMLLNALYAHNRGEFAEAIAFYTRILEMHPDTTIGSLIYKHRGMAFFAQSCYEAAIADFSAALALNDRSYKAAYYRGVVKAMLRRYAEAVEDFTHSLTINPYQGFCLYRRGQAYYQLGNLTQAHTDCKAALALEPDSPALRRFQQLLIRKLP